MNQPSLSPDDFPPTEVTLFDKLLHRHLEQVTSKRFYELCDSSKQSLLSLCQWSIEMNAGNMTLVILCHNRENYLHIAPAIPQLLQQLKQLSNSSKICIQRPTNRGILWKFEVEELSNREI
jgi:preprotein translocase subunit Sec63